MKLNQNKEKNKDFFINWVGIVSVPFFITRYCCEFIYFKLFINIIFFDKLNEEKSVCLN